MLCRKFELIHLNFLSYHLHLHVCILITLSLLPETSTDPQNELHLLPEPLFCLPSDNISMTAVLGTCTGRMFLAGKDGCLYEIVYQVSAITLICMVLLLVNLSRNLLKTRIKLI